MQTDRANRSRIRAEHEKLPVPAAAQGKPVWQMLHRFFRFVSRHAPFVNRKCKKSLKNCFHRVGTRGITSRKSCSEYRSQNTFRGIAVAPLPGSLDFLERGSAKVRFLRDEPPDHAVLVFTGVSLDWCVWVAVLRFPFRGVCFQCRRRQRTRRRCRR